MTTTRAAVCTGLNEPWKTEEIEIDPPGNREVRVKMVWSGMCHSDEHLRTGDISQTPEVLEMMGVKSMFPVVGGHEGSGIVTEVGDQRDPGGGGRPRRRVLHPLLRDVPLVCLGPPEPVRPRDDDAGRRHDQRRHLPLPPGGREPEPHGAARHVRRRDGRPRELARAHQPLGQHEGGRADQLRHRHRASARPSTGARSSPARRSWWPAPAASARAPFRAPASPGRATSSRSTPCPSSSSGPRRSARPTPRRRCSTRR